MCIKVHNGLKWKTLVQGLSLICNQGHWRKCNWGQWGLLASRKGRWRRMCWHFTAGFGAKRRAGGWAEEARRLQRPGSTSDLRHHCPLCQTSTRSQESNRCHADRSGQPSWKQPATAYVLDYSSDSFLGQTNLFFWLNIFSKPDQRLNNFLYCL